MFLQNAKAHLHHLKPHTFKDSFSPLKTMKILFAYIVCLSSRLKKICVLPLLGLKTSFFSSWTGKLASQIVTSGALLSEPEHKIVFLFEK